MHVPSTKTKPATELLTIHTHSAAPGQTNHFMAALQSGRGTAPTRTPDHLGSPTEPSSEASTYDAEPISKGQHSYQLTSDSSGGDLDVQDIAILGNSVPIREKWQNRHTEGTPLFTISEQRSFAVLNATQDNGAINLRYMSPLPVNNHIGNRSKDSKIRRQCFSLDENVLQSSRLPAREASSQTTSAG